MTYLMMRWTSFFFQAEDGIRDDLVTGVQTCALPISGFDVGSDLAGSVRTPAHFCGLFGLKPTEGRIPNAGHIPEVPGMPRAVRHMNVLGPLARSLEDLALVTRIMAVPDVVECDVPPVP